MTENTYEVTATDAVTTGVQQIQKSAEQAIAQPHVITPATGLVFGVDKTILEQPLSPGNPFDKFAPPPLLNESQDLSSTATPDEMHPDMVLGSSTLPPLQQPPSQKRLFTIREYPCGCMARGPGDVPAYCAEHGTAPAPTLVEIQRISMSEILDDWFDREFSLGKLRTVERQEWKMIERERVGESVNRLKVLLGL